MRLNRRDNDTGPRRMNDEPDAKPDIEGARQLLADVRQRRSKVDEVVAALAAEERLNSFQANLIYVFRGART